MVTSMSLWKALHVRFLCYPTNACADVVLSNITNMLFFFQAKGRIVVVPGNGVLSSVTGPVVPSTCFLASCPGVCCLIWLSKPGPQEEELLPWCK